MLGFGNNKQKEEEAAAAKAQQEQIGQAMKSLSDQIGKQAQTIKQLEAQLVEAQGNAAISSATSEALAAAQAELKQMHDEMEKIKADTAAGKAAQAASSAAAGSKIEAPEPATGAIGAAAHIGGGAEAVAAPAGGLSVGGTAYVQQAGGKNLRLRDAAGLESNAFAGLPPGTQMTLLAGPVEKDGYPWWHIRTADGREGWVAGTELVTHPE
jgi:ABC-type transporter Mla subunit MlaD